MGPFRAHTHTLADPLTGLYLLPQPYPGMPMAPKARDRETSSGQSAMTGVRPVASQTVWVLQPQRPTTWLPTGNAALLLWITLENQAPNNLLQ